MEEYLRGWVEEANQRFKANEGRSWRLLGELEKSCFNSNKVENSESAHTKTATWREMPSLNLRCHASVTCKKENGNVVLLVFGGYGSGPQSSKPPAVQNGVQALHRRGGVWDNEWTSLDVGNAELFKPTRNLSCCMLPSCPSPTVAIFGGRSSPVRPRNALLLFNVVTMSFRDAVYSEPTPFIPSPRYNHTMTPLSGRNGMMTVVVGGRDNDRSFADAHVLFSHDCYGTSFSWKRFPLPIGGIFNHAACRMPSAGDVRECILVSGGLENANEVLSTPLRGGVIRLSSTGDELKWMPPPSSQTVFESTFSSTLSSTNAAGVGDGSKSNGRFIVKAGGVEACRNPNADLLSLYYLHSPSRITPVPLQHVHPSLSTIDGSGLVDHTAVMVEKDDGLEVLLLGGGVGAFAFKEIQSPSYLITLRTDGGVDATDESVPAPSLAASSVQRGRGGNAIAANNNPPCALVHRKNVKSVKNEFEKHDALNKDFRIAESTTAPGLLAIPVHSMEQLQKLVEGGGDWAKMVIQVSENEKPPLSKLLISNSVSDNIMSKEDRKLSAPQRAVLDFYGKREVEGRKWIKVRQKEDRSDVWSEATANSTNRMFAQLMNFCPSLRSSQDITVCPKSLEQLGVDVTVVPSGAYTGDFFKNGKEEAFWKILAKRMKCGRIIRRATISPDSPTRESRHRILYPPHGNDTGISETTGEGSPGWVCVKEFGVEQWFDCTRVMFCRGNNSEKKRFASLIAPGEKILDLYAGIGYYTLPALLAHPSTFVYCCEWNPNAVFALRHNLRANGVFERAKVKEGDSRFVSYSKLVDRVSLGLLPSSEGCWGVAVRALKEGGGWVHVHGNVPTSERHVFGRWVAFRMLKFREGWGAWCKHTERVKSFAPKVDHLVADIYLGPEGGVEGVNVVAGKILVGDGGKGGMFDANKHMDDLSCALKEGSALGDQKWMFPLDESARGGKGGGNKKRVGFHHDISNEIVFNPASLARTLGDVDTTDKEESNDEFDMYGGMFDGGYDDEYEEIPQDTMHPEKENPNDDSDFSPNYLLSAVLAGIYEFPPLWLLKTQTSFGRRVRYKNTIARRLKDVEGMGWKNAGE